MASTTDLPESPSKIFHFFRLPAELRDEIYDHCYTTISRQRPAWTYDLEATIANNNLRLVCRNSRAEYDIRARLSHYSLKIVSEEVVRPPIRFEIADRITHTCFTLDSYNSPERLCNMLVTLAQYLDTFGAELQSIVVEMHWNRRNTPLTLDWLRWLTRLRAMAAESLYYYDLALPVPRGHPKVVQERLMWKWTAGHGEEDYLAQGRKLVFGPTAVSDGRRTRSLSSPH